MATVTLGGNATEVGGDDKVLHIDLVTEIANEPNYNAAISAMN